MQSHATSPGEQKEERLPMGIRWLGGGGLHNNKKTQAMKNHSPH